MIATHNIQDITFDQNSIFLQIDGIQIKVSLDSLSAKRLHSLSLEPGRRLFPLKKLLEYGEFILKTLIIKSFKHKS